MIVAGYRLLLDSLLLRHSRLVLVALVLITAFAALGLPGLRVVASSDALVMESDEKLEYFRAISQRYEKDTVLIVAFTPDSPLYGDTTLDAVRRLAEKLGNIPGIARINSILNVPLVFTSDITLQDLPAEFPSLGEGDVAPERAAREFRENPFYADRLVSADEWTTALQLVMKPANELDELLRRRTALSTEQSDTGLSREERAEHRRLDKKIDAARRERTALIETTIEQVRDVLSEEAGSGELRLGGLPMISSDMVRFVKDDLQTFGVVLSGFILVMLIAVFRRFRWIVAPVACCAVTAIVTLGLIGSLGWKLTVISSNALAILLIITLSLAMHVTVRVRDACAEDEAAGISGIIRSSMLHVFPPGLCTALTTIIAFASLAVSGIRPVIDLGWMMALGISVAFVTIFVLFPSSLLALGIPRDDSGSPLGRNVLRRLAHCVNRRPGRILALGLAPFLLVASGIPRLTVESRFIDNFRDHTEIHQGLRVIDKRLGGTAPLDIIISAPESFAGTARGNTADGLFADAAGPEEDYWFSPTSLETAASLQAGISALPYVGKVLSIGATGETLRQLNGGELPSAFQLALIRERTPEALAATLFAPYLGEQGNEIRIAARIRESDPGLNRAALLERVRSYLSDDQGISEDRYRLTGMLVLYSNMLQSLFASQIKTLGLVLGAVFGVFLIVFRSLRSASLAMLPNIVASAGILGLMGWLDIPLDMVTMTTAAVTMGIAVDDTFHYLYRFYSERAAGAGLRSAVLSSHAGVGKAILYTTLLVTFGFSLLATSNFVPTGYFGILTAAGMMIALAADLVLLPAAILLVESE